MLKLILRLIGFLVFACSFISVVVFIGLTSLGWIDLQRLFPGLPDVPEINTGELPVDPFGEFEVPSDLRPGESVPLRGQVQPRPLLAEVPVPQQLSTDPRVIGTNFFLAIIMALVFGATSSTLSNMLRDEEPRIQTWLRALGITDLARWVKGLFTWTATRGVRRGCLTMPLVLVIFALYGAIFAFLEEGTSVLSLNGLVLAGTLAFSVGLVSFGGDIARRIAARLWREKSSFNLYPVNLAIAVVTVAVSRVARLTPGIVFGTPGGADIEEARDPRQQQRRDVTLGVLTVIVLMMLGALGWAATAGVVEILDTTLEFRVAQVVAKLLSSVTNVGLAIFLTALQTSFFELLPFAYTSGRPIFQSNKLLWIVFFVPISFVFAHALINPQYGLLESFAESDVRFLWFVMVVLVGITAALWFYFNLIDDALQEWMGIRRRRPVTPRVPPGYYGAPPPDPRTYDPNDPGGYRNQ